MTLIARQAYDLNEIAADARRWREAALLTADAVQRDRCARIAAIYEQIVEQSIRTPVLAADPVPPADLSKEEDLAAGEQRR